MKKLVLIVPLLAIVITVLIALSIEVSNCGGDTAALHATRVYIYICRENLLETGNESVTLDQVLAYPYVRQNLDIGWGVKSYWLKEIIRTDDPEPIAICAQNFSNYPQPTIWNLYKRTPGHAASFINGTARVLTVEEFNNIDFSKYRFIDKKSFAREDAAEIDKL